MKGDTVVPQKRVRVLSVFAIVASLLLVFCLINRRINSRIADVRSKAGESRELYMRMQKEEYELENTLALIQTNPMIEDIARRNFNYMKRDELRLVITNPEVLYGGVDEIPAR